MFSFERNPRIHISVLAALAAFSILASSVPAARAQAFASFDAPGAGTAGGQGTFPMAINRSGLIVGYFVDGSGVQHGFMRAPDGTFTVVDVPGSSGTRVTTVNSRGLVAGYSYSPDDTGFLRYRNGSFGTLNVPATSCVDPVAMNDIGQIAGEACFFFPVERGFLWTPGKSVVFEFRGAGSWVGVNAMNSSGVIAGGYSDAYKQRTAHAFVRDTVGNITSFDAQDSTTITIATAINGSGQVTGYYVDSVYGTLPFLRNSDGTISLFTVGAEQAYPTGINDAGVVVGTAYGNSSENAFERDAAGNVSLLILPYSNLATTAVGINLSGRVVGTYYDSAYAVHGWLMTP